MKEELIKLLENERWFPMFRVTNTEYHASEALNSFIDNAIKEVEKLDEETVALLVKVFIDISGRLKKL